MLLTIYNDYLWYYLYIAFNKCAFKRILDFPNLLLPRPKQRWCKSAPQFYMSIKYHMWNRYIPSLNFVSSSSTMSEHPNEFGNERFSTEYVGEIPGQTGHFWRKMRGEETGLNHQYVVNTRHLWRILDGIDATSTMLHNGNPRSRIGYQPRLLSPTEGSIHHRRIWGVLTASLSSTVLVILVVSNLTLVWNHPHPPLRMGAGTHLGWERLSLCTSRYRFGGGTPNFSCGKGKEERETNDKRSTREHFI